MPKFYPMMMNLKERHCLVVGGGDVAARKIEMLVSCGAKVKVVAPEIDHSLKPLLENGSVNHLKGEYEKSQIDGVVLVIAGTDNEAVNRAVYEDASSKGVPVNVVDVPDLCSFIVPSVVERGDLLIAISTSGKSPAFSKQIRKELQKKFGPEYAEMLKLMGEVRKLVIEAEPNLDKRMKILSEIANSDILERIKGGETFSAKKVLETAVSK